MSRKDTQEPSSAGSTSNETALNVIAHIQGILDAKPGNAGFKCAVAQAITLLSGWSTWDILHLFRECVACNAPVTLSILLKSRQDDPGAAAGISRWQIREEVSEMLARVSTLQLILNGDIPPPVCASAFETLSCDATLRDEALMDALTELRTAITSFLHKFSTTLISTCLSLVTAACVNFPHFSLVDTSTKWECFERTVVSGSVGLACSVVDNLFYARADATKRCRYIQALPVPIAYQNTEKVDISRQRDQFRRRATPAAGYGRWAVASSPSFERQTLKPIEQSQHATTQPKTPWPPFDFRL